VGIYEAYYNCRSEPFSLSPDPRFLYLSPSHREALAQLRYVVELRKGFAVLTGEVGLGKTTLLRTLLERLGPQVRTAYIFNPPRSVPELYAAISHELDLKLEGVASPIIELNQFVLAISRAGGTVVLIFDEAQRLPAAILEEIRLLSNLEALDAKLLQVILAGQAELDHILDAPELRALAQRIVMRHSLSPLGLEDTVHYIANRVRIAGAERSPFTLEACRSVHRLSGGVPRVINLICDHAMLASYAADRPHIDGRCVEMAAHELHSETPPSGLAALMQRIGKVFPPRYLSRTLAAAAIALLIVLLAAAGVFAPRFYFPNEREHRPVQGSTSVPRTSLARPWPRAMVPDWIPIASAVPGWKLRADHE